jgi:metal-dependent amidase/aminoacylase/carboxypeptidase family protein
MNARPDLLDGVDNCFALHFMNAAPPGVIYLSKGPVTAITIRVSIVI